MKHLQLQAEILAEGTGGRVCKDPYHTSSTLGVPSLVSQLSLPAQPRVGGSCSDNRLHPALGTGPSRRSSLHPQPCGAMQAPGTGAVENPQPPHPYGTAPHLLPPSRFSHFTLTIVFPQQSTSCPEYPLQVNSADTWEGTQVSHPTALPFISSPLELKQGRVAPDAAEASRSLWCNGAVGADVFAEAQP